MLHQELAAVRLELSRVDSNCSTIAALAERGRGFTATQAAGSCAHGRAHEDDG